MVVVVVWAVVSTDLLSLKSISWGGWHAFGAVADQAYTWTPMTLAVWADKEYWDTERRTRGHSKFPGICRYLNDLQRFWPLEGLLDAAVRGWCNAVARQVSRKTYRFTVYMIGSKCRLVLFDNSQPQHRHLPTPIDACVGFSRSPDRTSRLDQWLNVPDPADGVAKGRLKFNPRPGRARIELVTSWLAVRDLTNCANLAHTV